VAKVSFGVGLNMNLSKLSTVKNSTFQILEGTMAPLLTQDLPAAKDAILKGGEIS